MEITMTCKLKRPRLKFYVWLYKILSVLIVSSMAEQLGPE